MKPVTLSFLWHMHQPFYRFEGDTMAYLPWVRLHAIRSYYDMVAVLEEFPEVRVTINLVPSLIEQLRGYESGGSDLFLEVAKVPSKHLTENERRFLFKNFFSAQVERMIKPLRSYAVLLEKRDNALRVRGVDEAWREFSEADYRDLRALFDLSWFGFKARERFPRIEELRKKGSDYTEEEISEIHGFEKTLIGDVIPLYSRAAGRGQIEISVCPYAHPILPLIVDADSAREALPDAPLPRRFREPHDAQEQLDRALVYIEKELGHRPVGLWPAEGAVSQDVAEMASAAGLRWMASDEGVLVRSVHDDSASHYRAWRAHTVSGKLALLFRDRDLSDRIGFAYKDWVATDAVSDLLTSAASNVHKFSARDGLVVIALDGENPWEHYAEAGSFFLRTLYGHLQNSSEFKTLTLSEAAEEHVTRQSVSRLHAGSWIYANFATWIGGPQKNRAWGLLGKCREALRNSLVTGNDVKDENRLAAKRALHAAEGSDWFWWLDGQYESLYITEFDRLFRGHLARAFELLGMPVPPELEVPLTSAEPLPTEIPRIELQGILHPQMDGRVTDLLEWREATHLTWAELSAKSAMQMGRVPLLALWLGYTSTHQLCLRLDRPGGPEEVALLEQITLEARTPEGSRRARIVLGPGGTCERAEVSNQREGKPIEYAEVREGLVTVSSGGILELSIACTLLGLGEGQDAALLIGLKEKEGEVLLRPLFIRLVGGEKKVPGRISH